LYSRTLGRFLLSLDDVRDDFPEKSQERLIETKKIWPPWGDDGDDDGDKPINRTERAFELASKVHSFEEKIADASLDLCVPPFLFCVALTLNSIGERTTCI
jgi:hypothetical protein